MLGAGSADDVAALRAQVALLTSLTEDLLSSAVPSLPAAGGADYSYGRALRKLFEYASLERDASGARQRRAKGFGCL